MSLEQNAKNKNESISSDTSQIAGHLNALIKIVGRRN